MENPVLISAVRTAIGRFQGTLSSLKATELGAAVVREAVKRSKVSPDALDEVLMGNVLSAGLGQAPARQAAIHGGIPPQVPAATINKVCGSGLKTVMLAAQAIKCGDARFVVAGGMESMTNSPYIIPAARDGLRLGHGQVVDSMVGDGLWDPYKDFHMGNTGELVAEKYQISREEQDEYAAESHAKAVAAIEAGKFKEEILPLEIPQRKKDPIVFDTDEGPRAGTTAEKLGKLKPVFKKGGSVTAGNASTINDGAAAVVVADRAAAKEIGAEPLAEIVAYSVSGMEPEWVMMAPEPAIRMLWEKTGWSKDEVDLYEINEAFSVQQVALRRELGIPAEKHNARGGGVSLGHPIGASGARCLVSLVHAMRQEGKDKGIVSLCLGGGNAVAMALQLP
jgi:acetyl-CoA C-acetyltransferase